MKKIDTYRNRPRKCSLWYKEKLEEKSIQTLQNDGQPVNFT